MGSQTASSIFISYIWQRLFFINCLGYQVNPQPVPLPWPTCTQVNLYPGSQVVPAMEKSTHNKSLGYDLTYAFQWNRSTGTLCKFYQIQIFLLCLFFYMNAQCQLLPWVNLNFFQHCYWVSSHNLEKSMGFLPAPCYK